MNSKPKRRLGRFVLSVLIAAVVAVAFWTVILMIFEEQFIYFPFPYDEEDYKPAQRLLKAQDIWFHADDGVKLHAWFVPADRPIATLVMSHGNAGNLAHRYELLKRLQSVGLSTFIYDYRGYGLSNGSPNEEGVYKDGVAAFDAALKVAGVDSLPVILFGTSLGGAVAVDVATQRQADGLILEATFTSARDMAETLYPFLPVKYLLRTGFNSVEKIKAIHIPLLSIHGERDSIVPKRLGFALYLAANHPKAFYEIPGADHNDTFLVGGQTYLEYIRNFAQSLSKKAVNAHTGKPNRYL